MPDADDGSSEPEPSKVEGDSKKRQESPEFQQMLEYARDLARVRATQQSLRHRLGGAGGARACKVLVADDEPAIRSLLSVTLSSARYDILEASTGTEALALIQTHRPDLVLLDVRLPNLNGLEVCRQVKADPALKDIPIVLVSALTTAADLQSALDAGADHFIGKPFSPLLLMEVVEGLLAGACQ